MISKQWSLPGRVHLVHGYEGATFARAVCSSFTEMETWPKEVGERKFFVASAVAATCPECNRLAQAALNLLAIDRSMVKQFHHVVEPMAAK